MTTHMDSVFLDRAKTWEKVPALAPAWISLKRALLLNNDLREHHAKVANDPNLSPIGRQDAVRKFIAGKTASELHTVRKSVDTMRAKLTERRSRLAPPAPDKTDMAAAVLRSEMRTMLRGMNNGQRTKLLMAKDADPTLLQAVLEAPSFSSGVQDDVRSYIVDTLIEKGHPGALAKIEQANEAADLLDAAVRVVTDVVLKVGEFPTGHVMESFVATSLGSRTAHLEAAVERDFNSLANVA